MAKKKQKPEGKIAVVSEQESGEAQSTIRPTLVFIPDDEKLAKPILKALIPKE